MVLINSEKRGFIAYICYVVFVDIIEAFDKSIRPTEGSDEKCLIMGYEATEENRWLVVFLETSDMKIFLDKKELKHTRNIPRYYSRKFQNPCFVESRHY